VAKVTKLAQGLLDLHSARGNVDLPALAEVARSAGGSETLAHRIAGANTTAEAFNLAGTEGVRLGEEVAVRARDIAAGVLAGTDIVIEIAIFDRDGKLVGKS